MNQQPEQIGIKALFVGQKVVDDDYGEGIVESIEPTPRQPWHPSEIESGKVSVKFIGGESRVVASSCLHVDEL